MRISSNNARWKALVGALLEGRAGIETLSGLTTIDLEQAVVITVAEARRR